MFFLSTKLDLLEKRYAELESLLCSPEVLADSTEVKKLSVERSSLEEVVNKYKSYHSLDKELAEIEEMLKTEDSELKHFLESEKKAMVEKKKSMELELSFLLLPKDPNEGKNVLMEVRAGTGGEEAALFAAQLLRMYTRFAERKGWKTELMNLNATGLGGIKEAVFSIQGKHAWSLLKFESGVHRVQRVPETESSGRVHTSTATVAVLPEAEEVDVVIQESDLKIDTFRASGAGGQYVNKTESAIRITHVPTGFVVACQDERSQRQNREKAMRILRTHLYEIKMRKQIEEQENLRRQQVGTGERSEKIRTYNFPQSRITDHRLSDSFHNVQEIMDGNLDELMESLRQWDQEEALKAVS
ncbi:MAG: peptide chain release factor 1 [Candidatus Eremiobacteraeota bacterium]|jgi:peptide chain release factor 1|nr:peptide chain release factor 1 [Candidatus Eremiobacteraeota bacterium]MCL5055785.1 peptide chain release factor 1 [Bacillota bacterium]